jgi:hypothetical protein
MLAWWRRRTPERVRLTLLDACISEVQDVETLAALPLAGQYAVAVAGRGTQVFAYA